MSRTRRRHSGSIHPFPDPQPAPPPTSRSRKTRDTVAEFSVSGHLARGPASQAARASGTVHGQLGRSAHGCRVLAPAERVRQNWGRLSGNPSPSSNEDNVTSKAIPKYQDLLWPTLRVLNNRGGSASIQELSEHVARELDLADDVLEILHGDGPETEVDYRAAWARTNLKWIGAIDNTRRGIWTITDIGRKISSEKQVQESVRQERRKRQKQSQKPPVKGTENDNSDGQHEWRDEVLAIVRGIAPDAFERLCQRILRESGFTKVEVTGRSGDGGIDGAGVLRVELISFHVRFQCKRYTGAVRAREIRDFRGAMVGRADKGLFITTGHYTRDAIREAVRDGAPAIDLIDGLALCELLKSLELGVRTQTVEVTRPKPEFFKGL